MHASVVAADSHWDLNLEDGNCPAPVVHLYGERVREQQQWILDKP